ncbi:MAG: nicotinate phosphoribosyltransferase [Rhodospirillaceae bacterium]|nr:nicotinate phosphoribosyltransferase [Rhodospirillaceae bacterium]|tara:strand:+ start:426 stop:1592 length:1167 start_codon:yes stop_codon:yes gene_type:complete
MVKRLSPRGPDIIKYTDRYFVKTRETVGRFGDKDVTYAIFMRRPVCFAPRLMLNWLDAVTTERNAKISIDTRFKEGDWVGAGDPLIYLSGSFHALVDLETLYLQRLGAACVAAYNAYTMCATMPKVGFVAMDARHCAGTEMSEMMAYAASVGSNAAKNELNAKGFIGSTNDATSSYFGNNKGIGTMPHALVGYAGSTLRAAEMYNEAFPEDDLTALVDYYGKEVTDSLEVCAKFLKLANSGRLAVRLDTHGGRYIEGLDMASSYAVLDQHCPRALREYRSEAELRWLVGTGVTAAAIYHMRDSLDNAGFPKVQIIASSGFGPEKCRVMASAEVPVDIIGTGSYLPENWSETYATADIVAYDSIPSVKVGREFLINKRIDQDQDTHKNS